MNRSDFESKASEVLSSLEELIEALDEEFGDEITASTGSDLEDELQGAVNHLRVVMWLLESCPVPLPDGKGWEYPVDSNGVAKLMNTPEDIRRLMADCSDDWTQ